MTSGRPESRVNSTSSNSGGSTGSTKWDSYTQAILDKGAATGFGVYSSHNCRVWTATVGFRIKPEQLHAIVSGFTDEHPLRVDGIQIQDKTYTFTRMDLNRRVMVGRCSASGAGCVLYLCNTCVLVATCEPQQLSLCFCTMEKVGDYLLSKEV